MVGLEDLDLGLSTDCRHGTGARRGQEAALWRVARRRERNGTSPRLQSDAGGGGAAGSVVRDERYGTREVAKESMPNSSVL